MAAVYTPCPTLDKHLTNNTPLCMASTHTLPHKHVPMTLFISRVTY